MNPPVSVLANDPPHAERMDANYRWQRFVYDLTRRFYLLGRISLLEQMPVPPQGHVMEIGCGTAWNLIRLARLHPTARLTGLDASRAMLETARQKVAKAGFSDRIELAHGMAEAVGESDPPQRYDAVFFSYALSMIPDWRGALAAAVPLVRPGGVLGVVDFGDLAGLPRPWRRFLRAWLRKYHTQPRDALPAVLREIAASSGARLSGQRSPARYSFRAIVTF